MPFLPVGGQAVIEGVMMRSPSRVAVAVRRADGGIAFHEEAFSSVTRRIAPLGWPVVRGAVSLFETLFVGIRALNFSADEAAKEEGAKPGASGVGGAAQGLTLVLSLAAGVLLFVVLPAKVTGWIGVRDRVSFGLVDGLFRLLAFVGYLLLIRQWKDMQRVLGYHGAEHKAIHALEHRAPLTPESVQTFSRFHPRCGTSFLFLVVVVSIVAFTFVGRPRGIGDHLLRVACMPLIAGIAFEFIRFSGRHAHRPLVRALIWPGMQFQRLTTREPDLAMCEVAIAALDRVRDDEAVRKLVLSGADMGEVAFVQ